MPWREALEPKTPPSSCLFSQIPANGNTEFFPRKMPEFTRQHLDTRDTGVTTSGQRSSSWTAAELTGGKWR